MINGHQQYPGTSNGVYQQKMNMWSHESYTETRMGQHNAPPSAMSGVNSLHSDLIDSYNMSGYHTLQDQLDDLNRQYEDSRAQRIRAAMFPESMDDQDYYRSHDGDMGQSGNVQRMAMPSQMLKTAIMNLINYQDDAELATRAVPELIKLLQDDNQVIVGQAAMMVNELSKRESSRHALVRQPQPLIEAVVRVMDRTKDADTARNAAGSLYHLSQDPHGLLAIFRTGGIPALIKMLYSPLDAVLFYAITTLHNLLMHQDGSKQEIRAHGGVQAMCSLVNRQHDKLLAVVFDCLHYLAAQHDATKLEILQLGATPRCVDVLRCSNYEKLLYTASRLMKVLSVCPQNKAVIVQNGGVHAVQRNLQHPSSRLVRNCLLSVRNLSDAATKEENLEELLRALIQLLNSNDREIVCCACGILSNLTCNNQRNKQTLCTNGVIDVLIRILETHANNVEITEPALCALRHLTSRHEFTTQAQNAIRTANGFPIICELLASMRPPVVKAALGLVRNLAVLPANLQPLREQTESKEGKNMVELSAQVLNHAFATIGEAQMQGQPSMPVVEGVSMLELVECSTAALHQLARDRKARQQIKQMQLIGTFVHLLSYEHENVQRAATGVLKELAQEPDGAQQIERDGATATLTELLHSRNEVIATYAGAILYKLSSDKPTDYRQQLGMEMASALYRDESAAWTQDGLQDMQAMPSEDMFNEGYGNQAYEPSFNMNQMSLGTGSHAQPMPGTWTSSGPPRGAAPPSGWYDTDL